MSTEVTYLIVIAMIIFMKIIVFILGYLTIRLGYHLIASGVKGEFKFSAKLGGVKTDLASISPGLLFVLLGIFLIGFAIFVEKGATLEKRPWNKPEEPRIEIPEYSPFDSLGNNKIDIDQEEVENNEK